MMLVNMLVTTNFIEAWGYRALSQPVRKRM